MLKMLGREEEEALFSFPIALCTHPMFCFIFFLLFTAKVIVSLSLVDFKSFNLHIPYLLSLLKPLLMVRTI